MNLIYGIKMAAILAMSLFWLKKISEAKNILKSNNISVNTGKTYLGKIILIREVKFLM